MASGSAARTSHTRAPGNRVRASSQAVGRPIARQAATTTAASETLVREWISDRLLHEQRALELAGARPAPVDLQARLPSELRARLSTFGVVRGLSCAEPEGLLGDDGAAIDPSNVDAIPASVPGVLRAEQARRDGRDLLPGREDPRLQHTGFRVVGAAAFVQKVRER